MEWHKHPSVVKGFELIDKAVTLITVGIVILCIFLIGISAVTKTLQTVEENPNLTNTWSSCFNNHTYDRETYNCLNYSQDFVKCYNNVYTDADVLIVEYDNQSHAIVRMTTYYEAVTGQYVLWIGGFINTYVV